MTFVYFRFIDIINLPSDSIFVFYQGGFEPDVI